MEAMSLSKREQLAVDTYIKHRSQRKAAEDMGISRRSFRNIFDRAKSKMNNTPVGFKTTKIATDAKGKVTAMQHKLAPEITDEERTGKVVRRSTLYGADGSVTGEWVIRTPEEENQKTFIESVAEQFKQTVLQLSAPPIMSSDVSEDDLALFMSIDEHIGVRLTAEQTGKEYGLDDAVELMTTKFKKLVERTPKTRKCLFVNLGDQFHANDHMDVTPASKHTLHSATTFNTVSDAVVAMNRWKVDLLLSQFGEVDLRGVAGNHDYDPMGWLFRCYDIAYENSDRVDSKFWSDELGVYQFGNNMLGFHHGHMMKAEAMAGTCADRYPEVYGATKMRYLHSGHIHHDRAIDTWGGFKWESHRTMNPKDWYSHRHGYLSRQSMKSMIYNDIEGEVGRYTTSLI